MIDFSLDINNLMEDEKNIEQISHEQDQDHRSIEHNTCKQDENGGEVLEDRNKSKEGVEVGEKSVEIESSKKPKQSLKPNPKTKVTIPKPFSLATDRRKIARESRGDFVKENTPTLTRSRSLINHRALPLPQVSNGDQRNSVLSRSRSIKPTSQTSLPPKITARKPVDIIVENGHKIKSTAQGNETEKTKPQLDFKVGGDAETKKPMKINTFKALSLPSFYHKKDSLPTPETKKIPVKEAKSMFPDKERKSESITGDKSRVERSVTSSAKETIDKLLKIAQKNRTKQDETEKVVVVSNA